MLASVLTAVLAAMLTSMLTPMLASMLASMSTLVRRGDRLPTLEVDVNSPGILLRLIPQPKLTAYLLNLGLDLLHVVCRVVSLADDGVQVRLPARLVRADTLLEDALRLLDELPVQVDAVRLDAAWRVVLAEDVVRRLTVVIVHLGVVRLALVGELLGPGSIAGLVRALGLEGGSVSVHHSSVFILMSEASQHTRSKHWPRFSASERARSRSRSYSRSASSLSAECKAVNISLSIDCITP